MDQLKNLTPKQIESILVRQKYLEDEILGKDIDTREYILEYHGGQAKFYKKWLWDWLSLGSYASDEPEQPGEVLELNMEGETNGNN